MVRLRAGFAGAFPSLRVSTPNCRRLPFSNAKLPSMRALLDFRFLLLIVDAQDLRTEASGVERVVRVSTRDRASRPALVGNNVRDATGRPSLNVELLRPEVVQRRCHVGAVAPFASATLPAKLNAVWPPPVIGSFGRLTGLRIVAVEAQVEVVGHLPVGVEADRVQLVLLFAMLLLDSRSPCWRPVSSCKSTGVATASPVSNSTSVEAVALQPHGLLAAVFLEFVAARTCSRA